MQLSIIQVNLLDFPLNVCQNVNMTTTMKTLAEMRALVKETFGDEATVDYDSINGWVIHTGWEEKVDVAAFAGTAAETAYNEPEGTYGSTLDRWMVKNHASASVAIAAEQFNASTERSWMEAWLMVKDAIADGRADTFDWDGWAAYRDDVISIGEKYGWEVEDIRAKVGPRRF